MVKKVIVIIIFGLLLAVSYINSTSWFRVRVADYYIKDGQTEKATDIYKKIYRKEKILSENKTIRSLCKLNVQKKYDITLFLADYYQNSKDAANEAECLQSLIEMKPALGDNYTRLYRLYMVTSYVSKIS